MDDVNNNTTDHGDKSPGQTEKERAEIKQQPTKAEQGPNGREAALHAAEPEPTEPTHIDT